MLQKVQTYKSKQRRHSIVHHSIVRHSQAIAIACTLFVGGVLFWQQQPAQAKVQESPVVQAAQGIFAVAGAQGTDLYDAPDGTVSVSLLPGATLTALGRTADSQWILVEDTDGTSGWVTEESIVIFGEEQLPVMNDADVEEAMPTSSDTTETAEATDPATEEMATPTANEEQPTATPSPTTVPPTPTPLPPTATPSPTAVPPTPSATSAPTLSMSQSGVVAVVGSEGATLYDSPDADSGQPLAVGIALTALQRSADSTQLYVTTSDGETGWVSRNEVVTFNTNSLPIAGDPANETSASLEDDSSDTAMADATAAPDEESGSTALSPTAVPTNTVIPTATNTPLPTPTPTQAMRPTPDADGQPTAEIALTGSRLNIRSGPNTQFPVVGKALPREIFIAQGRNGDSSWVRIAVPDISGGFGWVSTRFVRLSDPIASLPISLETNDTAAPTSSTIADRLSSTATTETVTDSTSDSATQASTAQATTGTSNTPSAQPAGLQGKLAIQTQWGGTFYLYDLASGALTPITGGLDPALSPDGSEIAFTRIGGNAGGVYLIGSDGSDERQIFGGREQLMAPKWSPDGNWIVFSRSNGSYTCNDIAFVGCISDGQLFPVPPGGLPPAVEEAREDVLDNFERVSRPNWQISRVNTDGKEYRDIAALDSARAPDWTEAGIAYQSAAGIQITTDTPEGDTRLVYYDGYGYDWDPDWQPGGGRIVYQSKEGPHWEIFAVNPDGTGVVALTRPVTTLVDELPSNVSPVWSPDGQYIAYLSNRTDNNEAGPWRVWVMNADGSNQRPLPIDLEINYGFAGEQMISWGP